MMTNTPVQDVRLVKDKQTGETRLAEMKYDAKRRANALSCLTGNKAIYKLKYTIHVLVMLCRSGKKLFF